MDTNKHGTISAAEAREIVQAVQAGVGEGEVDKVLEDIMTKIRSEAGQGKSSTSFSLACLMHEVKEFSFWRGSMADFCFSGSDFSLCFGKRHFLPRPLSTKIHEN